MGVSMEVSQPPRRKRTSLIVYDVSMEQKESLGSQGQTLRTVTKSLADGQEVNYMYMISWATVYNIYQFSYPLIWL
jgi:hypothetical protein